MGCDARVENQHEATWMDVIPKKKRKSNNPDGRPSVHGEATVMISARLKQSIVDRAREIGPTLAMGLDAMILASPLYRKGK